MVFEEHTKIPMAKGIEDSRLTVIFFYVSSI